MEHRQGIVLMCDLQGTIQKVIQDQFNFNLSGGMSLLFLVDKAETFFNLLEKSGMVSNCVMTLKGRTLQFSGFCHDTSLFITGIEPPPTEGELYSEFSALNNDLTNLQRALAKTNAEIQIERDKFRVTLENIYDAVIATDERSRITFMNPVAEELLGVKLSGIQGKRLRDVFVTSGEGAVTDRQGLTEQYLHRNGAVIPIESHEAAIYDSDDNMVGCVLTFRDISERKLIELERERLVDVAMKARAEAESTSEDRLRFLGMISHELRTPLTAIKGFSSTLLADDIEWDKSDLRQFYQVIDDEANKMSSLIGNLLEISRLQAQSLAVSPERIQLSTILASAKAQLVILTNHHVLETRIPHNLPIVIADPQRIAQVIVNLVDNAVKYSPPNSRIMISAERVNGHIQVNVSDEGKGIEPEKRDKVFEPFHQLENRGAVRKGVGLGLAICQELVEAHGGKIWIQPQSPPGTTISFTLPTTYG